MAEQTPRAAGFDGGRGFRILNGQGSFVIKLCRGSKPPSQCIRRDFSDQLLWFEPEGGEDPQLLWCNREGEWFELSFKPISPP